MTARRDVPILQIDADGAIAGDGAFGFVFFVVGIDDAHGFAFAQIAP